MKLAERIGNFIIPVRELPRDLVVPTASGLWDTIAPERKPTQENYRAWFAFDYNDLSTSEPLTPQGRALRLILGGYVTADGGEGSFFGSLSLHPPFNFEVVSRKPIVGEPSFILNIYKGRPLQLCLSESENALRFVLSVTEVPDRVQLAIKGIRYSHPSRARARSEVSICSLDGSQPYASENRGYLAKWELVGFNNGNCQWQNPYDPEHVLSQIRNGSLLKEPDTRWQAVFAQQTLAVLIGITSKTPRGKWAEVDEGMVKIMTETE